MTQITILALFAVFCTSTLVSSDLSNEKAGPFDLVDVSMQHCDDEGTQDFSYTLKTRKISRTAFAFSMNVTLKNYDLGDNLDMEIILDQFTNGGWKEGYFQKKFTHLCQTLTLFIPELFKKIVGRLGNGTCPIPSGYYALNETSLANFKINGIPSFFYNNYKLNFNILAGNVKIGCIRLLMTAVPKKKKPK